MKVQVCRASERFSPESEKTINMIWSGQFADELLKLNTDIPISEGNDISWEKNDDEEYSYIVSVNKKTRAVEIMLYDCYVE